MSIRPTLTAAIAISMLCSSTRTQKAPGEQIDDAVVLSNVKAALVADPVTEASEIDVEVHRGIVQLNGFVDSTKERNQAANVADDVKGVSEVRNNLAVNKSNESAGEVIDDALLTAKVKTALIASPDTKAHQINVETKEGVVQLSGFVDSATAKAAATTVAMSVTGVKNVSNELSIKGY
jgi:hyperosmotically inducible protein